MNKFFSRLAVSALTLLTAAGALAQNYPLPGSSTAAPVTCAGCPGFNPAGVSNDGLPTASYSSPIKAHVGRYVDSVNTSDWQGLFRTARAAQVVVAPTQRGSAPPRIYMQIGSAMVAYSLDTFFTTQLATGLVTVSNAFFPEPYHNEKALKPNAYVYPETQGWRIYTVDGQDRLFDFDYDDRGYVYTAYSIYGWGIVKDNGATGFSLVKQVVDSGTGLTIPSISVKGVKSLKSGSEYYALIYNPGSPGRVAVYNVTNPATIVTPREFTRRDQGIRYLAKNASGTRFALVDVDYNVQIYDTSSYLNGGLPVATIAPSPSREFIAVSADKDGNFWAVEQARSASTNVLRRISPSGGTYAVTDYNVFGGIFNPSGIHVDDNFIAVYGVEPGNSSTQSYNVRFFKIAGTDLQTIDTKNFFRNYYHLPPDGFAKPEGYTNLLRDVMPVKYNNKQYVIYADHGLGDVYELQVGDSITASYGSAFGTPNPSSKATQPGPYLGDPITFTAVSSTPGFPLPLAWDFGNPEAGAANSQASRTGDSVPYQFRGLSTAAQITTPRTVKVALSNDASTSDSVTINLKVPTPRVVVNGPNTVITASAPAQVFVAGDTFTDGSDGSVESHVATYTIDSTTTTTTPLGTMPVGALGPHTLTFTAAYGPYTAGTFAPLATPTYNAQIASIPYEVRPFAVTMGTPTSVAGVVTYTATSRRTTDPTIILPTAATWSVTWTLRNGATDIVPPQTTPAAAIGTIPPFVIANKSLITNNSVVSVSVQIPAAGLGAAAQNFGTASATQAQVTPNPGITTVSGCTNTGFPCSLAAVSIDGGSTSGWTYAWTLNGAPTNVTTSTYNPTFAEPGTYTVGLTVTSGIFVGTAQQVLAITGPPCGALPKDAGIGSMSITVFGLTSGCRNSTVGAACQVGETLELKASGFGYTVQACDTFDWNFGDSTTGSGQTVQHTFPGSGPYSVSMTITNTTGSKTYNTTITLGGNNNGGGGGPTCTAPGAASVTVSGAQGCNNFVPCKTGELVTFTAYRASGSLQSCDSVTWSFSDNTTYSGQTYTRTFNTALSSFVATATINNSFGTASASTSISVTTSNNGGGPTGCAKPGAVDFTYHGNNTECSSTSFKQCERGEVIQFTATGFGYTYQSCDQFEWTFGDGGTSTEKNPSHTFAVGGSGAGHEVSMRVYNTSGSVNVARTIRLTGGIPALPSPELTVPSAPATAAKNTSVTFSTSSNMATTGWTWNFGDGTIDTTQAGVTSTTSTISHTYATAAHYQVTVSGRNASDQLGSSAPLGSATRELDILNTPEFRFLLPVVTRIGGFGGSIWHTDVQVYNPDPNVSASNPLVLNVTFKGVTKQISVSSSTFISEDFIKYFTDGSDSGPMTISVLANYQPQIWTRTYNQAANNGTYGQFIPAVLLTTDGSSATSLPTVETAQFLPGLRSGVSYRTNVGIVNPMDHALNLSITAYNDKYEPVGNTQLRVESFDLKQFLVSDLITSVPTDKPYTIKITVPANTWIIAYGSMIDQVSQDPTYIGAVNENDVAHADFNELVIPGVGHTGPWRSDVTIFNPEFEPTQIDLTYYNQAGEKSGEVKTLNIKGRNFLQIDDLLRAGVLAPQAGDGVGSLHIKTTWPDTRRFPIAYSRTYNFNGTSSFGQGIPAFSANRANVRPSKPAFIPAVRNDPVVSAGNTDKSYYTNIGLVNLSAQAVKVKVTLLRSDTGAESNSLTYDLTPYQSLVGNILEGLGGATRGSLKVSIEGNSGAVWAFASIIDRRTGDPEYLAGIPTP